jgi:hypothetical protein
MGGDVAPVLHYLPYRRAGQVSPIRPEDPFAHRFVITVEDERKILVEYLIPRIMGPQDKFLEKPGSVPEVPFGRGDIRNGLHYIVFCLQRFADILRSFTGFQQSS